MQDVCNLSTSQICFLAQACCPALLLEDQHALCDLSLLGVWVYCFITCAAFFILLSL
jgi:hypothetical protein